MLRGLGRLSGLLAIWGCASHVPWPTASAISRSVSMETSPSRVNSDARVSTGSVGLDDILGGGLDPERMYLIEGRPGTGKTTIALQFLLDGRRRGERVLYVTMSETERELRLVAARHGWNLDGLDIFELVPAETS